MQYTLKKSLGQHFLKDENVCRKILDAVVQHKPQQLLEVGPGGGALTKHLLSINETAFKAVEVDQEKVDYLLHQYPQLSGKIIHQSFLEMQPPFEGSFDIAGNFPYNISSQILFKVLEWRSRVPVVTGMFQKEVAQRIAASPHSKSYGILSVLVQAYYRVNYLFEVSEQCFQPPPKVKSAVIALIRRDVEVEVADERKFFLLVKTAFNQRRKMLRNGVKALFDEATLQDAIFSKRAEQLSVDDFAKLSFRMK